MQLQCQNTRRFLDDSHRVDTGVWACPYCPAAERYELAEDLNPNLHAAITRAIDYARSTFQRPDDNRPTRIFVGEGGECVYEVTEQAFHIYVSRGNNWLQNCYQGSHEACHRVCTEKNAGRWPDEMLAILFSLRFLRTMGLDKGATLNETMLRTNAGGMSVTEALNAPRDTDTPELYGRCFLIGKELMRATGWDVLARLASHHAADGSIDVGAWLSTMPRQSRRWAERVLAS